MCELTKSPERNASRPAKIGRNRKSGLGKTTPRQESAVTDNCRVANTDRVVSFLGPGDRAHGLAGFWGLHVDCEESTTYLQTPPDHTRAAAIPS